MFDIDVFFSAEGMEVLSYGKNIEDMFRWQNARGREPGREKRWCYYEE